MAEWLQEVKALTLKGQIKVPYTWSVGEAGSRFLIALRDEKRILGSRCGTCNTVYVPPRKNCGTCFTDIGDDEWFEVGLEGVVTAYTIVRYESELHPAKVPFAYAIVKLDGADVGFLHVIRDNLDKLENGVRVKPKFAEDRNGQILDIDSFEIV